MPGWLVDRFGARRVILIALTIFGAILALCKSLSGGIWQLYLLYIALGVLINDVGPIPYAEVISHWFDRRRRLAIGLMMVGIGAGAMIMPSLAHRLITSFGWRTAFAMLGCAILLIPIPIVAAFFKERPRNLGLLADGAQSLKISTPVQSHAPGMSPFDARRSQTFWLILCALFLTGASVQGCLVHLPAMLTDSGASGPAAALGISIGAEVDIIAFLIGRYFGLRCFGQLYSMGFAVFVLAGALGPLGMGAGFDLAGSYRLPLAVLFVATVIASLLMARLGPYQYPECPPEQSGSIALLATEQI